MKCIVEAFSATKVALESLISSIGVVIWNIRFCFNFTRKDDDVEEDPLCSLSVWLIWQFKTVIRRDMGLRIEDIALVCRHKLRLKTFIISIFCLLIAFFYSHGTEIICIVYCCNVNTQLIFLLSRQYSENKSWTPKIKPLLKSYFQSS